MKSTFSYFPWKISYKSKRFFSIFYVNQHSRYRTT